MGAKRYLLQHQRFVPGVVDFNATRHFATLAEARQVADAMWASADRENTRQVISDSETNCDFYRQIDGSWTPFLE
jgi:hypothetical protein